MNTPFDDDDLHRRFQAMREETRAQAPSPARMRASNARASSTPAPTFAWWRLAVPAFAVVAVLVGLARLLSPPEREVPPNVSAPAAMEWDRALASLSRELEQPGLSAWEAPTDFLLQSNHHNERNNHL